MKLRSLSALTGTAICAFAFSAGAQSIGFWVNTNSIFLDNGQNLNRSNYNQSGLNVTVYGGTVASLANLQTSVLSVSQSVASGADALSSWSSFLTTGLSTLNALAPIPVSTGVGPQGPFDWIGTQTGLTPNSIPILVVTTQPIGSLTANDSIGIIAANVAVVDLVQTTVGFTSGAARWTTTVVGQAGSLVLMPIPEPATYAWIMGLLAVALVWLRRRAS